MTVATISVLALRSEGPSMKVLLWLSCQQVSLERMGAESPKQRLSGMGRCFDKPKTGLVIWSSDMICAAS